MLGIPLSTEKVVDEWSSKIGKLQIIETDTGECVLKCNRQILHRFFIPSFLFSSFRPEGKDGDEIYLLGLNAADTTWFHIFEVKKDKTFTVSSIFGNGGEMPEINFRGQTLEIIFRKFEVPRGIIKEKIWIYKNHQLSIMSARKF